MSSSQSATCSMPQSADEGTQRSWSRCFTKLKNKTLLSVLRQILELLLIYGSLWGIFGEEVLPGSETFSLLILVVTCYIGGLILQIVKLPPLLGMLLVGFMLRNVSHINVAKNISQPWAAILRNMSLVIILLRAGLGLDPVDLKRLSMVCLRLSITPCIAEAFTIGVIGHFLLDLPFLWSFMLGFVLGAVSPAIIVPSMLSLKEKGLGVVKGIPTLVIAAASVDDVICITGFGIMLGITFSKGNLTWTVLKGPLEVLIGLVYGGVLGVISWYIPSPKEENVGFHRAIILLSGGLMVMFVSQALEFSGSGALGCLSLAFVAALKWRTNQVIAGNDSVSKIHAVLWQIFQPVLFGLIGAEVSIGDLEQKEVGYGMLMLVIALLLRMGVTYIITYGAGLCNKERIFISFAWLPKATVQAAIGSIALDYARSTSAGEEMEGYGKQVLTIAVLSILVTAPLGAIAIALLAPILLKVPKQERPPSPLLSWEVGTKKSYQSTCTSSICAIVEKSKENEENSL